LKRILIIILLSQLFIPALGFTDNTYIRKELIKFSWGKGPYQLGTNYFEFYDENGEYIDEPGAGSHVWGPTGIKVDRQGSIIIKDELNSLLVKYDRNGRFIKSITSEVGDSGVMAFDSKNNLYIERHGSMIKRFDNNLKFLNAINYGPYNFQPHQMWINEADGIILLWNRGTITEVDYEKPGIYKKISEDQGYESKYSRQIKIYNEKTDPADSRKLIDMTLNLPISKMIFKTDDLNWFPDYITEKQSQVFLVVTKSDPKGNYQTYLIKYDYQGKVLLEILLDKDERLYFTQEDKTFIDIDDDLNIYHLWITKQGPRLVKWKYQK
jgi:hypothetical protein